MNELNLPCPDPEGCKFFKEANWLEHVKENALLKAENKQLRRAGNHLYQRLSDYGEICTPGASVFSPNQEYKDEILAVWEKALKGENMRKKYPLSFQQYVEAYEELKAENKRLRDMVIEERLPNFCTGVECGCADRVVEARKKERIKLHKELEQALENDTQLRE